MRRKAHHGLVDYLIFLNLITKKLHLLVINLLLNTKKKIRYISDSLVIIKAIQTTLGSGVDISKDEIATKTTLR